MNPRKTALIQCGGTVEIHTIFADKSHECDGHQYWEKKVGTQNIMMISLYVLSAKNRKLNGKLS